LRYNRTSGLLRASKGTSGVLQRPGFAAWRGQRWRLPGSGDKAAAANDSTLPIAVQVGCAILPANELERPAKTLNVYQNERPMLAGAMRRFPSRCGACAETGRRDSAGYWLSVCIACST